MLLVCIYVNDNNARYTYQFLKEFVFQLHCTLPHIACNGCFETKEYLFGHGLLQTYSLATQILSKSLRSYSVFVRIAVKHFTRSDGINHWWSNYIKYSECVSVALGTQHANRMLRVIMSSVACVAVPHFLHYLINGTVLGEICWTKNLMIFIERLSKPFLILRRAWRNIVINAHSSSLKCPLFSPDCSQTEIFGTVSKNTQMSNFMKIRLVGAELLQANWWTDRRTDMMKLIGALRNFANALKILTCNSNIVRIDRLFMCLFMQNIGVSPQYLAVNLKERGYLHCMDAKITLIGILRNYGRAWCGSVGSTSELM
jgi:hypothetical protein